MANYQHRSTTAVQNINTDARQDGDDDSGDDNENDFNDHNRDDDHNNDDNKDDSEHYKTASVFSKNVIPNQHTESRQYPSIHNSTVLHTGNVYRQQTNAINILNMITIYYTFTTLYKIIIRLHATVHQC